MRGSINFRRGVDVQVHWTYKNYKHFFKSSTYFTEVQWVLTKKTIISRDSTGIWGDGLFPIETRFTCDFPGGPDPISLYLEDNIFF